MVELPPEEKNNDRNMTLECVKTPLDTILEVLVKTAKADKQVPLSALAVKMGAEPAEVLSWGEWLENHGFVHIRRQLKGEPSFAVAQEVPSVVKEEKITREPVESYPILSDGIPAKATILPPKGDTPGRYLLRTPPLGPAAQLLFDEVAEHFLSKAPLPEVPRESGDYEEQKHALLLAIKTMFVSRVSTLSGRELEILSGRVLHKVRGLLDLELYLGDDWIEELAINGHKDPLAIYHRKHGWLLTDRTFESEKQIETLAQAVSRQAGTEISTRNPVVDARLASGDRSIATLFPISSSGDTLTIRRFSRNPWTLLHFLSERFSTMSVEIAALLWQAMHYELNLLIAGGTASGKTSVLNALSAFIPPHQRTISIEDTREISLPETHSWNWVPLAVRQPNPEGEGEVSMLELMQSSLRMRPDRMIVGEVRKHEQVLTMFEAMNTGHAVCSSIHADTADQVVRRLMEPPIKVPVTEAQALQLVLVQHRDRSSGVRKTIELVEVLSHSTDELKLNYLYRWHPRKDAFEKVSESVRLVEELNLHTGMTREEISADLSEKEGVLRWMLGEGKLDLDEVGEVVARYYADKEALLEEIE